MIGQTVAVAVLVERARAQQRFLRVGQAVAVAVGPVIGRGRQRGQSFGLARVGHQRVRPQQQLARIAQAIAVLIGAVVVFQQFQALRCLQAVGLLVCLVGLKNIVDPAGRLVFSQRLGVKVVVKPLPFRCLQNGGSHCHQDHRQTDGRVKPARAALDRQQQGQRQHCQQQEHLARGLRQAGNHTGGQAA